MAAAVGVPNPGNPAQVAAITGAPVQPRQPAGPAETVGGNVPNPGNPAQQQINQKPAKNPNPVGGGVPYAGDTPNPQNPAQGTPAAILPVTVPPQDAIYYDQLARLNAAQQGALLGYTRTTQQADAAYAAGNQQLLGQLATTQRNTRDQANSQGLLESGILGGRADANTGVFNTRNGALIARDTAIKQAAMDRLTGIQAGYEPGVKTLLDQATARRLAADLAAGPTTPTTPGAPKQRASRGPRSAARNTFGLGVSLTPHPAQRQTSGSGAVAHTTLGLNGTPTGRALANTAQQGINVFGVGGNLRKQAARRVVKGRG